MNKLTDRCTDLKELNKLVRVMLELALADINARGVKAVVFETYRSQERQNYLYCQGRTIAEATASGINTQFAKAYCNPLAGQSTWTLNSVHKSRKAVDVVPVINGRPTWSHNAKEQQVIEKYMAKYGFECGANWTKNQDSCHYQVKGNFIKKFDAEHNTPYVTKVIQKALKIKADGQWGPVTTKAINSFIASKGKSAFGKLDSEMLRILLSK